MPGTSPGHNEIQTRLNAPRRQAPGILLERLALEIKRARGMPRCPEAPAARVQRKRPYAHEVVRGTGSSGIPHAMVLRFINVLSSAR